MIQPSTSQVSIIRSIQEATKESDPNHTYSAGLISIETVEDSEFHECDGKSLQPYIDIYINQIGDVIIG
jgi:hypothetical protein